VDSLHSHMHAYISEVKRQVSKQEVSEVPVVKYPYLPKTSF
jgi:hypothetical protein